MNVLLEIKDSKAEFIMELVKNLSGVKATPLTPAKARFLKELRESVEEINQIRAGKKSGRPIQDLLDEL